jgi:hypothetical protein
MNDLYISKEQAEAILLKDMRTAGIPLHSITARCMFEVTEDSRGGHNCKLGPTPLWDRKLRVMGGRVLRSEFMETVAELVESGHKFQRAGRAAHRVHSGRT